MIQIFKAMSGKGLCFLRVSNGVYNIIFNILVAVVMSALMSLILTIINVGIPPGFFGIYMRSFFVGVLVAIPVSMIAIPLITRMLGVLLVKKTDRYKFN